MKNMRIFLSSFVCLIALTLSAQQSNIWYFGNKAGVTFASGPPVALTDGQLVTTEGCATMCDASGNLLFYTDGVTVWNRLHAVMANGTGLLGHASSTQSAIIIDKPGSANGWYIFTSDADVGPNGIRYSEVDLSLSAGLGAITTKNVLLQTPSCEKLTAIRHCNNRDVWVLTHDWNTNAFRSWLVTSAGISPPVVSNSGSVITGIAQSKYGQLKTNLEGNRILSSWYGLAGNGTNKVEVHNFSNTTGVVSGGFLLSSETGAYGCEFSPDSRLAYASTNGGNLIQFNLCAGTQTQIQLSRYQVASTGPFMGSMQLGPDGKIYLSRNNSFLSVINNPNVIGSGCGFTSGAVSLLGRSSTFGLPNYASFYNRPILQPFTYNVNCLSIHLTAPTIAAPACANFSTPIVWLFGDGNSNAGNSVTWNYAAPGIYTVSMIAHFPCYNDTVQAIVPVVSCCNPNPHFNREG